MNEFMKIHSIYRNTPETLALLLDVANSNGYGTIVRRTDREDEKSYNLYIYAPKDGSKPLPWGLDRTTLNATVKEILESSKLEPIQQD